MVAAPKAEEAVYKFTWFTATGSGILLAAIVGGLLMGYSIPQLIKQYLRTLWVVRFSLITIAAMLALGFLTRYSGLDATMGLAFAATGIFYPMFGTLLGWLGVALTGSDTASNVLFGGLQRVTVGTTRDQSGADGGGQQFRWGDGQNGRCAIDRGRLHRDPLVRA